MSVLEPPSLHFCALVFGTRLICAGDRTDALLKATVNRPSREPFTDDTGCDCERWRYSANDAITTFIVRSRRIISIEQRVGVG
jgi:hypothetical protein